MRNDPEYDDTDMTPEEFEQRLAAGVPVHVSSRAEVAVAVFVGASGNTSGSVGRRSIAMGTIGQFVHVVQPDRQFTGTA